MPLTASAVIGGISALGKIGVGVGQLISGNRKAKNNVRPEFNIQDEYFDNRDIAARQAQRGLSDRTISLYNDQAARGLSTTTSALLQSGGGINSVQGAYDQYLQGARAVAAQDAELQSKNIESYLDRNDTLAKQKVQQWVINKYQPYKDQAAAAAQEKSAGLQNLFGGAAEAGSVLSSFSQANNYKDLLPGANPAPAAGPEGMTPTASTTYYNGYNSDSNYGAFNDPYYVPPVSERATEAQQQAAAAAQAAGINKEQLENLIRTYKGKI